jgi:glycosyltransferase involved in cell wall biosynthesis
LGQGGAEGVLYRLIAASTRDWNHTVVSLTHDLYYASRLEALGIQVRTLDLSSGRAILKDVLQLKRTVAELTPDVVQTWMYHADLVGGLVARWAGARAIAWGIRHSNLESDKSSLSTRAAAKACAWLSPWVPAAIACCSEHSARVHQAMGYRADKFTVVHNGYDLVQFRANADARAALRAEWRIAPDGVLLGMVARWDPYKDHENLLRALALLKLRGQEFRCILVGSGMDRGNGVLVSLVDQLGLAECVLLAGPRDDIPAVMNALDLHVLSSAGEAFPNTVAEAMACGTPCVVTDVGDAALIVGRTGWVVSPRDAPALAQAVEKALSALSALGRAEVGRKCRARIEENFRLEKMVDAYRALWRNLACAEASNR